MRKVLFLTLLSLLISTASSYAQIYVNSTKTIKKNEYNKLLQEVKKDLKNTDEHLFFVEVGKLTIQDKIIVTNKTSYFIQQALVGYITKDLTFKVITTTSDIAPGERKNIASFSNNDLKSLRGKTLVMKIKGCKNASVKDGDTFNQTEKSTDVTYDFSASLSEKRHDLYIDIILKNDNNYLDF